MAEPRLQTAPRAVSVSATVTIPGGHLSVNDLEAAVLEAWPIHEGVWRLGWRA